MKSSSHSLQLEKIHAQQRRPSTAIMNLYVYIKVLKKKKIFFKVLYLCELIYSPQQPYEIGATVIISTSQHREVNNLPTITELAVGRTRFQTKVVSP